MEVGGLLWVMTHPHCICILGTLERLSMYIGFAREPFYQLMSKDFSCCFGLVFECELVLRAFFSISMYNYEVYNVSYI